MKETESVVKKVTSEKGEIRKKKYEENENEIGTKRDRHVILSSSKVQ